MRGTRRSKDFACETIFEFDGLISNDDLPSPRRRSMRRRSAVAVHFDFSFRVGNFVGRGTRNDTRIGETGAQQSAEREDEQQRAGNRN